MVRPRPILVAVAWPYANAPLHLGHVAGSLLPPDTYARYQRMRGCQVLMVSGSDEHGTPITVQADKEKVAPAEIATRYHEEHRRQLLGLGISFDLFYRTSDHHHKQVAQEVFSALLKKGHLTERTTQALFCRGCNSFRPDRYVRGMCPSCRAEDARGDQCDACGATYDIDSLLRPRCAVCEESLQVLPTVHQFLRLQDFQRPLEGFLQERAASWRPIVANQTRAWLDAGLKERAITRDIGWGVEVPLPGWDDKRLYVWFEAVIGYLSASLEWARRTGAATGQTRAWQTWWTNPEATHVYFMGKDNIPFHTIIWPSILMGYDQTLHLPDLVVANQYLTMDGAKLSKSKGNAISVGEFLEAFDADALRYYLSISAPEGKDVDFTWRDFVDRNNNELVATFGNYVHRVLHFTYKNFGEIPDLRQLTDQDRALLTRLAVAEERVADHLEGCHFKAAMEEIMDLARNGNQYIDAMAPWDTLADNKVRTGHVMNMCLKVVRALAFLTSPFLPTSCQRIWELLGERSTLADHGWGDALAKLPEGQPLPKPTPLFRKLRYEDYFTPEGGWRDTPAPQPTAVPLDPSGDPSAGITQAAPARGGGALMQIGSLPSSGGAPLLQIGAIGAQGGAADHAHVDKPGEQEDPAADLYLAVGHIGTAKQHPAADHLILLDVDFGVGARQVVAGLLAHYSVEELSNRDAVFLVNLKPARLRGSLSQGMLLAAEVEDPSIGVDDEGGAPAGTLHEGPTVSLLVPERSVPAGTRVVFDHLGETPTPPEVTITDFVLVPLELQQIDGAIVPGVGGHKLRTVDGIAIVTDRPLPAGSVVR